MLEKFDICCIVVLFFYILIMKRNAMKKKLPENKSNRFNAMRVKTKGFKFNRDEANER